MIVESDHIIASALRNGFEKEGYGVYVANDPQQALQIADTNCIDLVITEIALKSHSGFEFLYEFRSYSDWRHVPIFVYTSQFLGKDVLSGTAWGYMNIADYLYKPKVSVSDLINRVGSVYAPNR
jgi:DNA-binding response OmpR family regulator